jgi:SAM-dependent methyltransferase
MKPFELFYLTATPLLPPLYGQVRRRLISLARQTPHPPIILDVGGRKSHYTIGAPARITITDLPRTTPVQQQLYLGLTDPMAAQVLARRSNVEQILFDDMTRSALADESFECVVAVEVLEHVEQDRLFIEQVRRVLKPGGVFLMTTPNGDYLANPNPDHKRHYTRQQLSDLLSACFEDVQVQYAIRGGRFRKWGLRSWSVKHPLQTLLCMVGNLVNTVQSARPAVATQPSGTHHLIAVGRKRD